MLQACSKHYRPNRLGRVLFMGARGRFAFGRSRPRPSIRKGCLRLAQSGRRKAGRMAAPAGKLTTTAPFFIGGILRRKGEGKPAILHFSDRGAIRRRPARRWAPAHRGSAGDRRDQSWRRPRSTLVHEPGEPIEKRPLALENLCTGRWQVEPFGAIDLGKTLYPTTFRWPLDFESVTLYSLDVDIAFDSERDHPLAATLANFAERIKRSREREAGFLHELPARSDFDVLAVSCL